ncbi:conserved hypothetical protein [Tenacibaculum sp. 190524A05c]|uniref:transporter n=1 Tax=Tenacibaculum platacis TaxID=3137852 RepID=UPI0031FA818A
MKNIVKIAVALFAMVQTTYAQKNTELWSAGRPDGHAPISVMGDHYHGKGDVMFSYRYMRMNMEGLQQGSSEISNAQGHDNGYMVTPLNMPMDMHMLGVMYGLTDKITLVAMAMYTQNEMDLQMRMMSGMTTQFSTSSSGFGDVKLGMLYKFVNAKRQSLHAIVNLSIPTGTLEAEDVTPMSTPNKIQLPYPMQIGSGTYDLDLGLNYLGQTDNYSWGTQLKGTYRFDRNEFDYSLGNRYSLNSWFAYKVNDWISFSARGEVLAEERINGANPNLNPMMVTTADTANSGGKYINGGLGFNVYVPKGSFKNVRFGFEYAQPLYQELNGIQLERRETLTFGLQYSL